MPQLKRRTEAALDHSNKKFHTSGRSISRSSSTSSSSSLSSDSPAAPVRNEGGKALPKSSTASESSNKGIEVFPDSHSNDDDDEPIDKLAGVYKHTDFDPHAPSGPCPWGDNYPDLSKYKLDAEERQWIIRQLVQKKQKIADMAKKYSMKYQKIYGICGKVLRAYNLDISEGRGRPALTQDELLMQSEKFVADETCPWGDTEDVDLSRAILTDDQVNWFIEQINDKEVPIKTLSRRFKISYQKLHSYSVKSREGQTIHRLKGRPRAPDPDFDFTGCPWGARSPNLQKTKLTPAQKEWIADQVIEDKCNIAFLSRRYNISYQKLKSYVENRRNNRPFRTRKEEPLIQV